MPRQAAWKRWVKLILGWLFIVLGVLGLFLPILQGFLFLAVGVALLSSTSARMRLLLMRLRRRFPRAFGKLDEMKQMARAWLRRWKPD